MGDLLVLLLAGHGESSEDCGSDEAVAESSGDVVGVAGVGGGGGLHGQLDGLLVESLGGLGVGGAHLLVGPLVEFAHPLVGLSCLWSLGSEEVFEVSAFGAKVFGVRCTRMTTSFETQIESGLDST